MIRSARPFVISLGLIGLFAACAGERTNLETHPASRAALNHRHQTETGVLSVDVAFPAGVGLTDVTLGASGSLEIGDGASILAVNGSPGEVSDAAQDRNCDADGPAVLLRDRVTLGDVVSVGSIALGDDDTALLLRTGAHVFLGRHDSVGTIQEAVTLTPLVHKTMSFTPPSGAPPPVDVNPQGTATLTPGAYAAVHAAPRSTLTLSAGTYLFDSFNLEPDATLALDTSGGSIRLFVRRDLDWDGALSGDPTKFALAYIDDKDLVLPPSFSGTALAPNAKLHLVRGSYLGVFYGKRVLVNPGATVRAVPTPLLVGGIAVSNTTPCAGDTVEVTLMSANDPLATPWIQAVVGGHQFVQFGVPGPREVVGAVFTTDGRADAAVVPVTVQQCAPPPGSAPPVALHFWHALSSPNVVEMVVHGFGSNGLEVPNVGPASFTFKFGDGQTLTTASPLVQHDYTASINPMAQFNFFDVSVTVTTSAGTATTQKVVPILSLYALNRAKGIIQPPSALTAVSPTSLGLNVTNYEATPISVTQATLELVPCDPSQPAQPQAPLSLNVSIPASSTGQVNVPAPAPFAPSVCAIAVHLLGTSSAGHVNTDTYFTLGSANPVRQQQVTDPNVLALLNQASTLTASPESIRRVRAAPALRAGSASQPAATHPGERPGLRRLGRRGRALHPWSDDAGLRLLAYRHLASQSPGGAECLPRQLHCGPRMRIYRAAPRVDQPALFPQQNHDGGPRTGSPLHDHRGPHRSLQRDRSRGPRSRRRQAPARLPRYAEECHAHDQRDDEFLLRPRPERASRYAEGLSGRAVGDQRGPIHEPPGLRVGHDGYPRDRRPSQAVRLQHGIDETVC